MNIALLVLGGFASAQDTQDAGVSVELFHPHPDLYGYGVTQGAATLGNLQLGLGAWVNYSDDPVVLVDDEGNRVAVSGSAEDEESDGLVNNRLVSDFQVGMGFTRYVSVTMDIPLVMTQDSWSLASLDNPSLNPGKAGAAGVGDLVVQPKFAVLDRGVAPLGLAVAVPIGLPTGAADNFIGEGSVTVGPRVIAEFSDAPIQLRKYKWRAAVNAGYLLRSPGRVRDIVVGNQVEYAAAFGWHAAEPIEIGVEYHGAALGTQNSGEALLNTKVLLGRFVAINVGGGLGAGGGIGSPDYRIYGGVQIAPSFDPASRDSDDDGIPDGDDKCPHDTEDMDGYQDGDGCPELDNDADGREDSVDKCPDDPEDDDGFMDNDGCPDLDNDKDGVTDANDRCPDEAETANGYLDDDGCPDDKPVDDSDGDGLKDDVDRCPYDAEDLNGFEDEDGCPDERLRTARVVVTKEAIRINDVIYFDFGKATIQERSFDLLNEIAQVIQDHPDLKKVRVEGHTDDVGDDVSNFRLSQARAEAVRTYLKNRGVEAGRLDAAGFGEMRPIVDNDSDANRSKNRRVEFIIVDRD